ncbi:MAG: phosphotransferase family protein [Pseudomonadota bacterium]
MPETGGPAPHAVEDPALAGAFAGYYSAVCAGGAPVTVRALARIPGGASRETYAIDVDVDGAIRALILRRDPPASLIETDRAVEFAALKSATREGSLPVPAAIALETRADALGAPFFIMERIDGGAALNPFKLDAVDPHRAEIGAQFFSHLGAIAALPVEDAPLAAAIDTPAPDACWRRELDYWAAKIAADQTRPEPITEAAMRWLRANPPPPAQRLSIVHGDYRSGNFLHDEAGKIIALLDWEMAHIGDPYEDLAWATDPLWCSGDTQRAAGFLPWPDAIETWQRASGCRFDPEAFEWWSIFATVKAMGIWISSARAFASGENDDPILAWSGWFTHAAHEVVLASRLAPKFGVEGPA